MVQRPRAEFAVKLFGPEALEVMDGVGPEVEDVVPGEGVSFLDDHHFAAQQGQLDGCPQAAGTPPNDETLRRRNQL